MSTGLAPNRSRVPDILNVSMNPGRDLGMRFLLSPEDGFEPSHTCLLRVVQVQGVRDRVLAEGEFHLE